METKAEKSKLLTHSYWANVFKGTPKKRELMNELRELPPFAGLKKHLLYELSKIVHTRNYSSGEHIFIEGDPGIGLYVINQGEIEIYQGEGKEKTVVLARMSDGDFFGELALIDGETRSASAIARTDCEVSVIFKPDFDELLQKNPKEGLLILTELTKIIITRLRQLNIDYSKLYNLYTNDKGERS